MTYVLVKDQLPTCDMTEGSLGTEVLIKPAIDGDPFAFYGCRISASPCFYRGGASLNGVKSWAPKPPVSCGSLWRDNDVRYVGSEQRFFRVVEEAVGGLVRIVRADKSGKPVDRARVTTAKLERFDGRPGGYSLAK